MASWCENHVGFNSGSLVYLVEEASMREALNGEELDFSEMSEKWTELGYGFCIPTNFEKHNNEVLREIGGDDDPDNYFDIGSDGEIIIKSSHPNFNNILQLIHGTDPNYYNEKLETISKEQFDSQLRVRLVFTITFCELEPPH